MKLEAETLAEKRRKNREVKAQIRRSMLQKLPKGGVCIEVGVWRGEFTQMLLNQLQPKKLTLIDPWKNFDAREDAFDGKTKDDEFERIFNEVNSKYAAQIAVGQVEVKRALSADALAEMDNESLDFAYLDGDHSYEGVKADLAGVFPLMKSGGVIMMDDYHRRGWWGDAVIRAAQEFLGSHSQEVQIRALQGAQLAIAKV